MIVNKLVSIICQEFGAVVVRQFYTLTGAHDFLRGYLLEHQSNADYVVLLLVKGDVLDHGGDVLVYPPDIGLD